MAKDINNIRVVSSSTGKKYFTTSIPEAYTPTSLQYTYISRTGDRWDTIAYKYLGNPIYWYVIARANGGTDGSIFIKPGTTIIIPEVV